VLDDGFDPNQTATDYTRLISQDKVNLLLGTFLLAPSTHRRRPSPRGRECCTWSRPAGAATLFTPRLHQPVLRPARHDHLRARPGSWAWIALAAGQPAARPTAAYVTQDDPSASPAGDGVFKTRLQALGIKTVYDQTYDPSTTNFDAIASLGRARPAAADHPGRKSPTTVAAFVRSLEKLNFSPRMLFPDQRPE